MEYFWTSRAPGSRAQQSGLTQGDAEPSRSNSAALGFVVLCEGDLQTCTRERKGERISKGGVMGEPLWFVGVRRNTLCLPVPTSVLPLLLRLPLPLPHPL